MNTMSKPTTAVMFRKYPGGEVIAVFPSKDKYSIPVMARQSNTSSFQDYSEIIMKTLPAQEREYIALYEELTNSGMKLRVIKKRTKR